MHGNPALA